MIGGPLRRGGGARSAVSAGSIPDLRREQARRLGGPPSRKQLLTNPRCVVTWPGAIGLPKEAGHGGEQALGERHEHAERREAGGDGCGPDGGGELREEAVRLT